MFCTSINFIIFIENKEIDDDVAFSGVLEDDQPDTFPVEVNQFLFIFKNS
jgi:hypothetical protein